MIHWKGYDWIQQERWGNCHKEKPHWWYDPSSSYIKDDQLVLETKLNPKWIPELGLTSSIGCGLVSCVEKFGPGYFSIEAKLPLGKNLWPAFWMWSWDTWPPEIDVFEAWSGKRGTYFDPGLKWWNIQTNVHYLDDSGGKMLGGKKGYVGLRLPEWIKFELEWYPNKLEFYYNNRLVRVVNDKKIMTGLERTKMNVVINNGVDFEVDLAKPPHSKFIVKDFKYEALK